MYKKKLENYDKFWIKYTNLLLGLLFVFLLTVLLLFSKYYTSENSSEKEAEKKLEISEENLIIALNEIERLNELVLKIEEELELEQDSNSVLIDVLIDSSNKNYELNEKLHIVEEEIILKEQNILKLENSINDLKNAKKSKNENKK